MLADRPEPLVGLLGEDSVRRKHQVGVSTPSCTPDPAAQLVELAETETVGPVHHEGVDRGHVDARLDDRGADQHVVGPCPEVEHDLLEGPFVHLAVRDGDPGIGDEPSQLGGDALDVVNTIVDIEDLALAQELPPDRLGDGAFVVLSHVGEDRLALRWRGGDEREVADSRQAHLERSGDRARGQGQDVDADGQLLDRLLVGDAETLLFVDYEKTEPLETDVGREETMGPDHDVDRPVGQAVDDLARLRGGEETRQDFDPDRVRRVPVGERLEMLLR